MSSMVYSYSIREAAVVIAKISGLFSIIGSILIARNIFKKWRGQQSNEHLPTTTRVVANMCIADIGSSFWGHFIGTWMVPTQFAYIKPFAAGTRATCTAQAFVSTSFIYAGWWCNVFLALSYYLTVCRQKSETELRNWKYQLLILGWPWFISIAVALVNTMLGGGGKVVRQPTWYCEALAGSWTFYFVSILIGLGLLIILFSMGSLIRTVYLTEKKMDRFCQGDRPNREKTLQVSKQGLSYIAAYLVVFIPVLVSYFAKSIPGGFYVFYACILPLQGFLNAIVFFRPKYVAARKKSGSKDKSRFRIMFEVLDVSVPKGLAKRKSRSASVEVDRDEEENNENR